MIPTIRKILCAMDLSPNADFVVRYAAASARRHDATIAVLHVVEPLPATARALVTSYLDEKERKDLEDKKREKLLDILRRRLDRLFEAERDSDPELPARIATVEVVEGYPADVILKKADAMGCDIVVIGTHGKGRLRTAVLGSVSQQVLRHSHKPIYVIPMPADADGDPEDV